MALEELDGLAGGIPADIIAVEMGLGVVDAGLDGDTHELGLRFLNGVFLGAGERKKGCAEQNCDRCCFSHGCSS